MTHIYNARVKGNSKTFKVFVNLLGYHLQSDQDNELGKTCNTIDKMVRFLTHFYKTTSDQLIVERV